MTEQEFRTLLKQQGFDDPVIVEREPATKLDNHVHAFEALALITHGDITIITEDSETTYHVGQTFHLQADVPHRETFGSQGVHYLAGRKERQ